jgi:hypothetical protein
MDSTNKTNWFLNDTNYLNRTNDADTLMLDTTKILGMSNTTYTNSNLYAIDSNVSDVLQQNDTLTISDNFISKSIIKEFPNIPLASKRGIQEIVFDFTTRV